MGQHLVEFSGDTHFDIKVAHELEGNQLKLEYKVAGAIEELYRLPLPINKMSHGKELWKKTCFECFFFEKNSHYAELNFNPLGEFDFLYFKNYRDPIQKKSALFKVLNISFQVNKQLLRSKITVEVPSKTEFLCSPTAILMPSKMTQESKSLYFALAHGAKADFHATQPIENKGFKVLCA